MSSILIIDYVAYKPYNFTTLATEPLGGTEASVLRLARALAKEHSVSLLNRSAVCTESGVNFITEKTPFETPDTVIHVRSPQSIPDMALAFPNAKHVLWLHDLGGPYLVEAKLAGQSDLDVLRNYDLDMVFVSNYHKQQFVDRGIKPFDSNFNLKGKMHVCYNIVDARPSGRAKDPSRVLYASSPHKGLEHTLSTFRKIGHKFPDLKLRVLNPGYMDSAAHGPNVVDLGSLPHHEVVREMEEASCLFSLNHVFPETMGLVYAEANAVGTPVLTHSLGALPEVLTNPRQFVNTRDAAKVGEALEAILKDPPKVERNVKFDEEMVLECWRKIV